MPFRIVFMGSPEFSVATLSSIIRAEHEVVAVYCQPPRPAGRGMTERKSPVHRKAEEMGIPVLKPVSLKSEKEQKRFLALNADIAVIVAYGLLLPQTILDAPRLGCINAHASLLPRWRGAAPLHRAIEAGDRETGITIMQMESGLDTGPMLMCEKLPIGINETTGILHDRLKELAADLMVRFLSDMETGKVVATLQPDEGVTYAKKIDKSEAHINWKQSSRVVHNHIRAMSPFPGAWFEMEPGGQPVRIRILQSEMVAGKGLPGEILDQQLTIACATGSIRPTLLQKAGKKPCSLSQFLHGNSVMPGKVLC